MFRLEALYIYIHCIANVLTMAGKWYRMSLKSLSDPEGVHVSKVLIQRHSNSTVPGGVLSVLR